MAGVGKAIWHFPKLACLETKGSCSYNERDFLPRVRDIVDAKLQSPEDNTTLSGKIILIGDVGVGKTSLLNRFCSNTFSNNYKATIGVDFEVEQFRILDLPFLLEIWDTAGQEKFRSLASAYYRGARAVVVAFDMADEESARSAPDWAADARTANQRPDLPTFLVGCKADTVAEYPTLARERGCKVGSSSPQGHGMYLTRLLKRPIHVPSGTAESRRPRLKLLE